MTPIDILTTTFKADKRFILPIMAGLAALAAATIFMSWAVDLDSAMIAGIYILAFGLVLILIRQILSNALQQMVLSWFVLIIVMAYTECLFVAAIMPTLNILPPAICLIKAWNPCESNLKIAANTHLGPMVVASAVTSAPETAAKAKRPSPPALPKPAIDRSAFKVFIQFATPLKRDAVRETAAKLAALSWNVQDTSNGGKWTANARGFNEVRFSQESALKAAELLEQEVDEVDGQAPKIGLRHITSSRFQIPQDTLEVWLSAPEPAKP
ncbi:hypothetical protein [Breoghania sp.]|uniref:hypothetical protein n=1 Tax=Breoghania sp. TaxID=2065378 RepID=UPI00262898B9|nr:hypothetical protein [Breoghania sp.]MDJ0929915.1 hypothetical protein [Breoghania sp.]